MGIEVNSGRAQHIGARANQQDAMEVVPVPGGGVLAILCDGMGGMEDGHVASAQAITAFRDCFLLRGSLYEAAAVANAAVAGLERNTGTTLIAAHVTDRQFDWISIGDSPLYLLRDGDLRQINQPHIFGNRLPPEEARVHPERDALTSYVGIPLLTEIDQSPASVPLQPGDRVVLASDGLSRALEPREIVKTLAANAQQSCDQLIAKVLSRKRPGQDNVSVILVSIDSDDPVEIPRRSAHGNQWGVVAAIFVLLILGGLLWRTLQPQPVPPLPLQPANASDSREPRKAGAANASPDPALSNPPQRLSAEEPRQGSRQ